MAVVPARAADSWLSSLTGVVGSGQLESEARTVGHFSAVEVGGSMKVVLRQGPREAVEVRADANLLPLITTEVIDRAGSPTLRVGLSTNRNFSTHNDIVVTITVVALDALTLSGSNDLRGDGLKTAGLRVVVSGSGDIRLTKLDAAELDVNISGSGNVEFTGRASVLRLSIRGSGDARAAGLAADDVRVSIAGSGSADVNARRTLHASIAGSGDITYSGDAVVNRSIMGVGSIVKR